jgi:hypothetical protein
MGPAYYDVAGRTAEADDEELRQIFTAFDLQKTGVFKEGGGGGGGGGGGFL